MRYFIKQAARFFQGYSVSLLLFLETSFLSESTAKEKKQKKALVYPII